MRKLTSPEGETAANEVFQGLYFIGSNTTRKYVCIDFFSPQHSVEAREIQIQKSLLAYPTSRLKLLMFIYYGSVRF